MAELRKINVAASEVKTEAKAVEAKPVESKEAPKAKAAPKKEAAKAAPKAAAAKKPVAKKPAAKKPVAKKPAAKKSATKNTTTKTATVKNTIVKFEFSDKSYTPDDLLKSAKDVWQYDFGKKAGELVNIELYVKPEESKVYYVFNDDITGSFDI
jgi:glucan-binding YG repeat protein